MSVGAFDALHLRQRSNQLNSWKMRGRAFFLFAFTAASIAAEHPVFAQCNLIWNTLRISHVKCDPSPTACDECLGAQGVMCFKHYAGHKPGQSYPSACYDRSLGDDPVKYCGMQNDLQKTVVYDSYANLPSDCKTNGGWSMLSADPGALVAAIVIPVIVLGQVLLLLLFAKFKRGYRGCALFGWGLFGVFAPVCAWISICCSRTQQKTGNGVVPVAASYPTAPAYSPAAAAYGQPVFLPCGMQPELYAPQQGYVGYPSPMHHQYPQQHPQQLHGYPTQPTGYSQGHHMYGGGAPMQPMYVAEGNHEMQQVYGHLPPPPQQQQQQQADLMKPLPYNPYTSP
jgi:hypothetical protein